MRILNLGEVQKARELSTVDRLKQCGTAFAVASTYIPALCDMAEDYLKNRMVKKQVKYSIEGDNITGWIIRGSDGFFLIMGKGDSVRLLCSKLVERLNGIC